MKEHRLIEQMIALIRDELENIRSAGKTDPLFIDAAVDFIRVYADRTHHGKEEDILFRDLDKKELSDADRRAMDELIEEHKFGRRTTKALVDANTRYRQGDNNALPDIEDKLRTLVDFYPKHIEKEDKAFFVAAMEYLSADEQEAMLAEFWTFDRNMIHEKYESVVSTWKTAG
jgi:hemerythrin-like domain-containing protein